MKQLFLTPYPKSCAAPSREAQSFDRRSREVRSLDEQSLDQQSRNPRPVTRRAQTAGFTLVELLFAVFFIFAALGAIIVTTNNVTSTGQHNEAAAQVQMLIDAARSWGRQPTQSQNYTDVSLDQMYCDGINISPFRSTGGDCATTATGAGGGQNVYGLDAKVVSASSGAQYAVTYATGDLPNCQALLDKFSVAAGVVTASTECTTATPFTLTVTVD